MVMAEVVTTKVEIAKIEGIQVVTAEVTGTKVMEQVEGTQVVLEELVETRKVIA